MWRRLQNWWWFCNWNSHLSTFNALSSCFKQPLPMVFIQRWSTVEENILVCRFSWILCILFHLSTLKMPLHVLFSIEPREIARVWRSSSCSLASSYLSRKILARAADVSVSYSVSACMHRGLLLTATRLVSTSGCPQPGLYGPTFTGNRALSLVDFVVWNRLPWVPSLDTSFKHTCIYFTGLV